MLFTKGPQPYFLGNIHTIHEKDSAEGSDLVIMEKILAGHNTAIYIKFNGYKCCYQLVCPD